RRARRALHNIPRADPRRAARSSRGRAVSVELTVPDIGSFTDVDVVDVLVKPGDVIEVDAPLVTLETDKASMDVPATSAGKVTEVLLKRGDKVSKGSVIVRLEGGAATAAAAKPATPNPAPPNPAPAASSAPKAAPATSAANPQRADAGSAPAP